MGDLRKDLPAPLVKGGAHHFDLRAANKQDTASVLAVRAFEETTIEGWIADFWAEENL